MSTIKANSWLNPDGTENYKCRAWVNFNGTGTVAIRASGNVSSITDNGTGNYTVNLTTAMPDMSYAPLGSASTNSDYGDRQLSARPVNTTSFRAYSGQTASTSLYDAEHIHVAVFR